MKQFFFNRLLPLFTGLLIGAGFFSVLSYAVFTEPSSAPPGGNVEPPINTGAGAQIKQGNLQVNGIIRGASYGFGGAFSVGGGAWNAVCGFGGSAYVDVANPITGGYSCPAGFTPALISHVDLCWPGVGPVGYNTYMCWK